MKLTSDISLPINNVRKNTNGCVSVKCKNVNDIQKVESVLSDKLGNEYCVDLEHLSMPKVKVLNVDNDLNRDELCEDIYYRNFLDLDGAFNIIADFKNKLGSRTLILELTSASYLHLKNNGFRIYIGFQCCRVMDYFNFNLCFKCGRSNHKHNNCKNEVKCLNCVYNNEKYHENRPTDHCAVYTCCEYVAFNLNKIINMTDYPVKPVIPNSLGKIGNKLNINSQQSTTCVTNDG